MATILMFASPLPSVSETQLTTQVVTPVDAHCSAAADRALTRLAASAYDGPAGSTLNGGAHDDVRSRPRRVARQLVLETRAQGTPSGRSRRVHAYPDRRRRAVASHLTASEPRHAHRRRRQPHSLGRARPSRALRPLLRRLRHHRRRRPRGRPAARPRLPRCVHPRQRPRAARRAARRSRSRAVARHECDRQRLAGAADLRGVLSGQQSQIALGPIANARRSRLRRFNSPCGFATRYRRRSARTSWPRATSTRRSRRFTKSPSAEAGRRSPSIAATT